MQPRDRLENLVVSGGVALWLPQGAIAFLRRHSMRERPFRFNDPYPNEEQDFGDHTPGTLIDLAVAQDWFRPIAGTDVVTQWATVAELTEALHSIGKSVKGNRGNLLRCTLALCPNWVEGFASA